MNPRPTEMYPRHRLHAPYSLNGHPPFNPKSLTRVTLITEFLFLTVENYYK